MFFYPAGSKVCLPLECFEVHFCSLSDFILNIGNLVNMMLRAGGKKNIINFFFFLNTSISFCSYPIVRGFHAMYYAVDEVCDEICTALVDLFTFRVERQTSVQQQR